MCHKLIGQWEKEQTKPCVTLLERKPFLLFGITLAISYGTNGMPDVDADQMYNNATVKGDISTMPHIPGLAVWHKGHIGMYIGGEVIEAMGTKYGVVRTQIDDRNWTAWLEVPYISYITDSEEQNQ